MALDNFLDIETIETGPSGDGLTSLLDTGLATRYFRDTIESHGQLVDFVKFGWGTSLVTRDIEAKISILKEAGIGFYFGGTLFELAYLQKRVPEYFDYVEKSGAGTIEISDGTLDIDRAEKLKWISRAAARFEVFSEVGYKNSERSEKLFPAMWIDCIESELHAGASCVVLEARESGTSGVCRPGGEVRHGLIHEILSSGVKASTLMFEAPNKMLQTYFVRIVGPAVNLGNIAFNDIVGVQTLRLGLRSETMTDGRIANDR